MNISHEALLERIKVLEAQLRSPPAARPKRMLLRDKQVLARAINSCPPSKAAALLRALQALPELKQLVEDGKDIELDFLSDETLYDIREVARHVLGKHALESANRRTEEHESQKKAPLEKTTTSQDPGCKRKASKEFVPYVPGSVGRPPAWYLLMREDAEDMDAYTSGDYETQKALYEKWQAVVKKRPRH